MHSPATVVQVEVHDSSASVNSSTMSFDYDTDHSVFLGRGAETGKSPKCSSNASSGDISYKPVSESPHHHQETPLSEPHSGHNTVVGTMENKEKPSVPMSRFQGPPPNSHWFTTLSERWLDFRTWFTLYRQLFFLVTAVNGALAITIAAGGLGGANRDLSSLVIMNVVIAIAIRNEWFLRLLYWLAVKFFRSPRIPVQIRKVIVGVLYHIGGLHSGCGVSALFWLGLSVYRHFKHFRIHHPAVLTFLVISISCIFISCITAVPYVRGPRHDLFERIHRFIGWSGILCTLTHVILKHVLAGKSSTISVKAVLTEPQFWLMLVVVLFIISSWITTWRVPVECSVTSQKATVIKFPGGLTSGLHTRVSRGGLKEWHIFGSISEGKHADCHYVVAAVQGEFTRSLNVDQPTKLYTKRWKPCGLPYFSRMFRRGVAVCTGSGIGAVGSTCIQHDNWFLIWIGPDLEATYGRPLIELIETKISPHRRLIWDTRGPMGRPDIFPLLKKTYAEWNAEVVLFIGSPAINHTMLRSSREAGIPLFGSIWDA